MLRPTQILNRIIFAGLICASTQVHASGTAYVGICCNAPSTVAVFAATSLAHTGTIATGSGGDGIALSPDGTKMFVTVDARSELQVIATATGAVLATVHVPLSVSGEPPLQIVISPNGAYVYILAPQARPSPLLMKVDGTTFQVIQTAAVSGSQGPLLISPDGSDLYFEVGYSNEAIQVIDTATLAPVKSIPVNGEYPAGLAVTPSGLILMTDTNNQLLVIDPQSSAVNTLTLPQGSLGMAGNVISSPDSTTAYIGFATGSLLAVNISTGATLFEAATKAVPTNFAISPDGTKLYSSNRVGSAGWSLSEFQIPTQTMATTVRQLGPISAVALTQDGQSLYVLNANNSAIAAVDVASQKVTQITLGSVGINSLAISPGGNTVWASDYAFGGTEDVLFLNPTNDEVNFVAGIGGALAFSPNGAVAYAYNPAALTAYDAASLSPLGSAPAGQLTNIDQVIPSPDGKRLYMSVSYVSGIVKDGLELFSPGEVRVLDAATLKYTGAFYVASGMGAMALTPDGSTLIFTSNAGRVFSISTTTFRLTGSIDFKPANGLLNGLALSPDGTTAYVADAVNNLLLVANLSSQSQTATIPVDASPSPIEITPDGTQAWVATLAGLDVVNVATGKVSTIALPGVPSAIVFAQ
jgi:YVTN family beta-propeller protein